MTIIGKFFDLLGGKKAKQVGMLYSSMVIGLVIGVGTSIVNTRFLGPHQYGDFKFLIHLFNFVVMFLTVGIFMSGSRLLAREENRDNEPGLKGAMLIYAAAISALMIIGLFIFSFFEEKIFHNNLGNLMRLFSPFLFIFPLKLCLGSIMMGTNEIYKLSLFQLFPRVFYLVLALVTNWLFEFSLKTALLLNLGGFALIIIIMVILLKPKFNRVGTLWRGLLKENKSYGFPVYISHLANTATAQMAVLSIAYFIDNTNVGYFYLAVTITEPLSIIPRVVGTTFFKDFANRDSIPMKATVAAIALAAVSLVGFLVLIKTLFVLIYTKDFSPAMPVVYFLSFSSIIHGFADYVNRFLGAHGRGKDMRNSAFIVAASNIVGYTMLVKLFLLKGAVFTRVVSSFLYLVTMLYLYKKLRNKMKKEVTEGKTGFDEN